MTPHSVHSFTTVFFLFNIPSSLTTVVHLLTNSVMGRAYENEFTSNKNYWGKIRRTPQIRTELPQIGGNSKWSCQQKETLQWKLLPHLIWMRQSKLWPHPIVYGRFIWAPCKGRFVHGERRRHPFV
jgi:hypothetical protein